MLRKGILVALFGVLGASVSSAQILVESFQKLSDSEGQLTRILDDDDAFGRSVANLGDLDGDGVADLAVGALEDDDGAFNSGAVWILFLNDDGTVKSRQKISLTDGDFMGTLGTEDNFGVSVTQLGDLDGDGVTDLAVGAYLDEDGKNESGAVWILFLTKEGTAKSQQKISATEGGFTGPLDAGDRFGSSVTQLGDLDGDGVIDLAVGAYRDDNEGSDRGAVWILFLTKDGTVKRQQKISDTEGDFSGALDDGDLFGTSVTQLGDLDGDGVPDLAVGATGDDDGGEGRGAVWILFLKNDGTVKHQQKISDTEGTFSGPLIDNDGFGFSVAPLGDIDDDGVIDLITSGGGTVWILFLTQEGTVKDFLPISENQGGFMGTLDTGDSFGSSLTHLGDLDGNTDPETVAVLAVGAMGDDDGGNDRGAVWMLFVKRDGTVKRHQKISVTQGDLFSSILEENDRFGSAVTNLGDLDGDGVIDLAVGAIFDDDGLSNSGAVWILFLNRDGTVKSQQKISNTEGSFTDSLTTDDLFGSALANLGDLDGDGVVDLAVGAFLDDDGQDNSGAVWILFLNRDGTVKGQQKISNTEGGFNNVLDHGDRFGKAVADLGDLNGDGIPDLAVGAFRDDDGGTTLDSDQGAVWILFLNRDGTVKGQQKISATQGGLFSNTLDENDRFGSALTNLGDLNGDGIIDLAVGAPLDDDGQDNSGAVWILFLKDDGTVKRQHKISAADESFMGTLGRDDNFGTSVTTLGDIDTDAETAAALAVGAKMDDDGGDDRGAVWMLFLKRDGTVKAQQKISSTEGNFEGALDDEDSFGESVTSLGDLNGDGVTDLAVGAPDDDDGASAQGALWMLFLLRNQAPRVVQAISDTALVLLGPSFSQNLDKVFRDPDNDPLTYDPNTSDLTTAVAFVLTDSILVVDLTTSKIGSTARITITAEDPLGAKTNTSFTVTVDELPEIGTIVPNPREPEEGEALTLSAKITDNNGFIKAVVLYRKGGDEQLLSAVLTLSDPPTDSIYTVTVPSESITDRGLEYQIIAVDNRCFATITPITTQAFVSIISQGARRPTPQPANAYRLISTPLDLQAKSPAAVLEDDLGTYDDTRWRFFEIGHQRGDAAFTFKEFPQLIDEQRNMLPGKAFLLLVKEEGKTIDSGPGASISTIEEYPIDLFPGWNFVGNPFRFTIPIENLRLQSGPSGQSLNLRTFADTWSDPVEQPVEQIEPFEGYAILNDTDTPDVLFINPDLSIAADSLTFLMIANSLGCTLDLPPQPPKKEPASEEPVAWSIRILAQSGPARDVDTRAVVAAGASPERDRLDHPEPPGLGDHVSVYFAHPEWQTLTARYSTDTRPEPTDGAVWPLEITSTMHDKVHLTFEGLADVPPHFEVWLVDEILQRSQNLRETPTYTVAGTVAPRPLKLVVGKRGFIENERQASQEIPTRFELFPNFPNPFNPSTTLRYGLPTDAQVSLTIYNVLGEKVVTLAADAAKQAGYHAEVWDGRNTTGASVASGVYFVRLRAGQFVQVQKMVLVK